MAIEEQPREDLLRDATAYRRRILVSFPSAGKTLPRAELFAGVRTSGAWSFYFGEDPVIQLNEAAKIRRLFWRGRKFVAEQGQLLELVREERGGRVLLDRRRADGEADRIVVDCQQQLSAASCSLKAGEFEVLGVVPDHDPQIVGELTAVLECLAARTELA